MKSQHLRINRVRIGKPDAQGARISDAGRRREAGPVVRGDVFVGAHKGVGIYAACWYCQAHSNYWTNRNLTAIFRGRGGAQGKKD